MPTVVYAQESENRHPTTEDINGLNNRLNFATNEIDRLEKQILEFEMRLNEAEKQKELDEKFNQLITILTKEQVNSTTWDNGDILISSATIFAFFGFGSFLVIRFRSKFRKTLVRLTNDILIAVWGVQIFQLFIIGSIVSNRLEPLTYILLLIATAVLLTSILIQIKRIVAYENREESRTDTGVIVTKDLKTEIESLGIINTNLQDKLDAMTREYNKLRRESGY